MNLTRTPRYGKPKEIPQGLTYWPEVYCAMCNQVPTYARINPKGESELYLGMLHQMPVDEKSMEGIMKPIWFMVCDPCVDLIEKKMRAQIMKRFMPPEDPPPPEIKNKRPWWWPF